MVKEEFSIISFPMSDPHFLRELEDVVLALTSEDDARRNWGAKKLAGWITPWIAGALSGRGLSLAHLKDITVTTVTKVTQKASKFCFRDGPHQFKAWVKTIAHHEHLDWLRKNPVGQPLDTVEHLLVAPGSPDEEFNEAAEIARQGRMDALNKAMAKLGGRDARIILLRFYDPIHEFKEIGEILGIPTGTARVASFRAVRRLARLLRTEPRI